MACRQILPVLGRGVLREGVILVQRHGEFPVELGPIPGGDRIILGRQAYPRCGIEDQGIVLRMCVAVGGRRVEGQPFEPPVGQGSRRVDALQEIQAVVGRRIVFVLGRQSQRLQEVLLPQSDDSAFL